MKDLIWKMIIGMLASQITEEMLIDLRNKGIKLYQVEGDKQLDKLEDYIVASETKVDDKVLPLIATLRKVIKIPDND